MKHRSAKRYISILAVLLLVLAMMGTASAKSLYALANIIGQQFDAWDVDPNGRITYQTSHNLSYAIEPVGIAVDADSKAIFITAERQSGFEMVDAVTMKSLGYVEAGFPFDLAGIDVDDKHNIIYTVQRSTAKVYAYDWDPTKIVINPSKPCCLDNSCSDADCIITDGAVTLRAGYPKNLPNCVGVFGIALDERANRLYITDSKAHKVRGYDMTTWSEVFRFTPSIIPAGIAVDRRRGFIYTTAPDFITDPADPQESGNCLPCVGSLFDPGFTLISKYDLATGKETVMDIGHGGMGIAVEEIKGYVYVAAGCSSDDVSIWDTSTYPFTRLQTTGKIGNPTGVVVENVSYNPLVISSSDNECMEAGEDASYKICFGSTGNDFDVTNVVIKDNLPPQTSFVSASDGGVYDPAGHSVSWNIGTLPGESPERCVQLVVHVDPAALPMSRMVNYATITSNETPPTTIVVERAVCCHPGGCPASISEDTLPGECGAHVTWTVPTFDNCGPVTMTSLAVYPDGSTRDNVSPGDFFPAECAGEAKGTDVTYIVRDPLDPDGIIIGICSFTVTVLDNIKPQAICTTEIVSVELDGSGTAILDPARIDAGSTDNCKIAGITVSPNTFTCDDIEKDSIEVTLTVTDTCGNWDTCTALVKVVDNIKPQAICTTEIVSVELDDTGTAALDPARIDAGSTDNCEIAGITVFPSTFTCDDIEKDSIEVTLTVTDTSGNTDTCTALVKVVDNIKPQAVCTTEIVPIELDGSGTAALDPARIDAGSTDNCKIAGITVFPNTFTCDDMGKDSIEVTLTVTDTSGNTDTCTAFVKVVDIIKPQAVCTTEIVPVELDGSGTAALDPARIDAGSTDNCKIAGITVFPNTFTCDDIGKDSIEVTLTVTDTGGYTDTCTALVKVVDNIKPQAVCTTEIVPIELDGSGTAALDPARIDAGSTDNCKIAGITVFPNTFTCDDIGKDSIEVTLTVTDTSGNVDTCTSVVKVLDKIKPQAVCTTEVVTVELDDTGTAALDPARIDVGSTDNCKIKSITVFPNTFTCDDTGKGSIEVTLTVTDTSDNIDTCKAMVTVVDKIAPVMSGCPVVDPVNGVCGGSPVSWTPPTFTDNCGPVAVVSTHNPGDVFPAGSTTVTYTAEDNSQNITICTFTVTVVGGGGTGDITVTDCPADIPPVNNDAGECGAEVSWIPPAFTGGCGPLTVTSTHNPGDFFPSECEATAHGTLVTYTASDGFGNEATCSFKVVVLDKEPPLVSGCPVVDPVNGVCGGSPVSWIPPVFTGVCGPVTVTGTHNPGSDFPVGETKVTYTGTDSCGNTAICTFVVTVGGGTSHITVNDCPSDITLTNNATLTNAGECGAEVSWVPPTFTGGCGPLTVTSTHNPGDFFPAECEATAHGTLVTYTASDGFGNEATCSFKVIVLDKEAPMVSGCPPDITVNTDPRECGAVVFWTPQAFVDNCGPVTVTSTHNPGDFFPVGITIVTYTGTDHCGNVTKCSFTITVLDQSAPLVTDCPADIIMNNDPGVCGAVGRWTPPVFTDNCGPVTVTSTHNPGDFFPAECETTAQGTVVIYTATDKYGNTASCSFRVIVLDKESPLVAIAPLLSKYFSTDTIGINYTAVDNCDPDPSVKALLSNNGDAQIDITASSPILLNLAKLVGHNVITITAIDDCGNVGMASVEFDVILKLAGRDQIIIKDEIQKMGITAFDAFIRFPAPYDALTIDKNTVFADGAPAMSMNRDWTLHQAICRFNRAAVTEVPEDDYFEVNGLFNYKGKICTFVGSDYIYRVLPPPRTPIQSPGQTPGQSPIQLTAESPVQSVEPPPPPIQLTVEPQIQSLIKLP